MSALVEMREAAGKLSETRNELKALFDKKGDDGRLAWEKADHDRFAELEAKAADEQKDYEKWSQVQAKADENNKALDYLRQPAGTVPYGTQLRDDRAPAKSVGTLFVESKAFKNYVAMQKNGDCSVEFEQFDRAMLKANGLDPEFKTTATTASGFPPFSQRTADVVPFAFRTPVVQDLMPSIPTTQNAVLYMEETTHTANAAPTAEATSLPESAIVYTQRTVNIEDVGTSLPVSERMLDDAPFVAGLIDASLNLEVDRAEETQLLTGNGTSPQLMGFLSTAAATAGVQTQAMGTDDQITAFVKAMTLVSAVGFANPSAGIFHPTNWQNIVTLKDSTGRFIFGNPSETGPRTLWGLPCVITVAMTLNSALVGDFRMYAYVARRQGVKLEMGWQNTNFVDRVRTIRAYGRSALVIRRKAAFCKVTGLP